MNSNSLPQDICSVVKSALEEDIGSGDITAELIPSDKIIKASIISRETATFCGIPWVDEIFHQLDPTVEINWLVEEGSQINADQRIASIHGSARSIMTAERTALNFLQTLSATASQSHHYAALVAHTAVTLLDTRKTIPGLRTAQKYAVRIGGCQNHRLGLFDAFLIKENHISACDGILSAVNRARTLYPDRPVEIEVQNLNELNQAISSKADIIMLDNFSIEDTLKAVEINNGQRKLEASGGIEKEGLVRIAETGVDYISIGALSKNCRAIDLSLLVDAQE